MMKKKVLPMTGSELQCFKLLLIPLNVALSDGSDGGVALSAKKKTMSYFKLVYMPKRKEISESNWRCFIYMQMSKICCCDHFLSV